MKTALFVGGPKDGQILIVDDYADRLFVEVINPIPVSAELATPDEIVPLKPETEFRKVLYKAIPFRADDLKTNIFALNGMTAASVLHRLISNYRPREIL